MLFVLGCLVAAITGITLYWLDANQTPADNHVTQWPRGMPDQHEEPHGEYEAAVKHMQVLATALLQYRDGPDGGGVRWPAELDVLPMAGLLDPAWSNIGLLSHQPVIYQPEMPIGHDPERWVLCHDIEVGRRRNVQTGYATIGPRAAAVILADGSVKLLEGDELEKYGGLNMAAGR